MCGIMMSLRCGRLCGAIGFFFSSRRRHTIFDCDWSSDVCSSDLAFDNHHDLVKSAAVDAVAITVKVPYHFELAADALTAGKAVYCEWPLGNGLEEAERLAALAEKKGVLAVVGLQARSAPSVAYVHDLIKQGYVGDVLSTTVIGSGMGWGPTEDLFFQAEDGIRDLTVTGVQTCALPI